MKNPSPGIAYFVGDIQYTRTPPASRTESYAADVLAKLRWIADRCRREDIVVLVGDIFHRKGRTTHGEVIDMLEASREFRHPVFAIPGNHDMVGGNVEEARRSGPFGVLTNRRGFVVDMTSENSGPVFVTGTDALVVGTPYTDRWQDSVAALRSRFKNLTDYADTILIALHCDTENVESKVVAALRKAFPKAGHIVAFNGHLHDKRSVHTVGRDSLHYVGALTRVAANEALLRPVIASCSLVDGKPVVKLLDVPVRPASEVFVTKGEDDTPTSSLEEFAVALREFRTESLDDSLALKRLAKKLQIKRSVWRKAKSYLDSTR